MKKLISLALLLFAICSCASVEQTNKTDSETIAVELNDTASVIERMATTDVLLLSDHTYPGQLNLSSGGADGTERLFIDPTIKTLVPKLENLGLSTYTLNVEDMIKSKDIQTKAEFNAAYAEYDKVLAAAVANKVTIIAIHYDANIIPPQDYKTGSLYVGGAQVILDDRAVSQASIDFSKTFIEQKILEQLNALGFRIRPGYENAIRYQANITLKNIGLSEGGATLLEIGAQRQALEFFGTPDKTAKAIEGVLTNIAKLIHKFRLDKQLNN
ncbi:MAG: hypothetical protein HWE10_14235 [Gammaproteobacteria bacterium]|nr:hypothetical protein [Gammaproteobacteria bacterium]